MKRLLFTLLIMCLTMVAHAQATSLTVDCQNPGWLTNKIAYGDQMSVRSLTVTGYLNVDDMTFIQSLRDKHNLRHIDLSDANIVGSTTKDDNYFYLKWVQCNYSVSPRRYFSYVSLPKTITGIDSEGDFQTDTLVYNSNIKGFFPKNIDYYGSLPSISYKVLEISGNCDSIPGAAFMWTEDNTHPRTMLQRTNKVICKSSMRWLGPRIVDPYNFSITEKRSDIDSTEIVITDFSKLEVLLTNALFTSSVPDTIRLPKITWFCKGAFRYRPGMQIYLGKDLNRIGRANSNSYGALKMSNDNTPLNGAKLHIEAAKPPKIINNAGFDVLKGDTIYVANGSLDAYLADADWKKFVDNGNIVLLEEPKQLEKIELSQHSLLLDANETATLTASPIPSDAANVDIHWSSSNDAVATVSDKGVVTAVSSGEAYIYAISGEIKDSCKVTVMTHVTGLEIKPSTVTFDKIGQSKQLQAVITPDNATNKNVTWRSMNESVCMVTNSGYAMALGVGSTVIIATTEDGSIPATCVVTVNDPSTGIKSVNADNGSQNDVYTINGMKQSLPSRGIVIIKPKDGKAKKVLINK